MRSRVKPVQQVVVPADNDVGRAPCTQGETLVRRGNVQGAEDVPVELSDNEGVVAIVRALEKPHFAPCLEILLGIMTLGLWFCVRGLLAPRQEKCSQVLILTNKRVVMYTDRTCYASVPPRDS